MQALYTRRGENDEDEAHRRQKKMLLSDYPGSCEERTMKRIDEARLEADLDYRFGYLAEFIGFGAADVEAIRRAHPGLSRPPVVSPPTAVPSGRPMPPTALSKL